MTVDELEKEISELSDADKVQLFERFGLVSPFINEHTVVEIDDMSLERENSPRAILHYLDGSVKAIDIFATVKKNAISIGHPAILSAIWRWEQLSRLNKTFFDDSYNEKYPWIEGLNRRESNLNERIRKYLKQLGTALLEGAKERELPREVAFKIIIEVSGLDKQDTYLYKAWKLLEAEELKKLRNDEIKLSKLNEKLKQEQRVGKRLTINRVLDFYRSTIGKPYLNKRFDWISTRNAFLAWRFNMDQGTIRRYFYKANKKMSTEHNIDRGFFFPGYQKKYNFFAFTNTVSFPTVSADTKDIEEKVCDEEA